MLCVVVRRVLCGVRSSLLVVRWLLVVVDCCGMLLFVVCCPLMLLFVVGCVLFGVRC